MSGMTEKKCLICALIARGAQYDNGNSDTEHTIVKADVPRCCTGNPHEGGHHSHCPGNK